MSINRAMESVIRTVSALTVRLDSGSGFSMEKSAVPRLNRMINSKPIMMILKSIAISEVVRVQV